MRVHARANGIQAVTCLGYIAAMSFTSAANFG
jgi:hypothetical protein